MNLGFTGSRHEPTKQQKDWLFQFISDNNPEEFHHGCCAGSDSYAHWCARTCMEAGYGLNQIVLHPPGKPGWEMKYTAWEYANCLWFPKRDYLARNRDIVNNTDMLVALPNGPEKMRGSGTWYTIRYANKQGKSVLICDPLGQIEKRNP